jgi:hypothetical protein
MIFPERELPPFSENPLSESASEAHPGPFFSFSGHFSMLPLLNYVEETG